MFYCEERTTMIFRILTQPLYTFPVAQRGCRVLEISPLRLLLVQRFPHFEQLF